MGDLDEGQKAFSSFRVLNGDANMAERDHLFRNMAQLFAYVSDRCDDDQVAQYDEVLCHLAELVEVEARAYVAGLLAPLARAPGTVVVKLANDAFDVARPLLEFSNVLSDDDLIEIIASQSELHRVAIAGREHVTERVGEAIVAHGDLESVQRLVRNDKAEMGQGVLEKLLARATQDAQIATGLRGRTDIDWASLHHHIDGVTGAVVKTLVEAHETVASGAVNTVNAVVFNRLRNRAGFSATEWKIAYNQVKALSDRRNLDYKALARFARFGYGHHCAASLTVMLQIGPEVLIKWLAMQDYVAITVALKAAGLTAELFDAVVAVLPWRDWPGDVDKRNIAVRFQTISRDEATGIFELWRTHAFRRRQPQAQQSSVA